MRIEVSEKERVVRVRCSHYARGVGVRTRRSPCGRDLARWMLWGMPNQDHLFGGIHAN